jgi:glycosyltransferase involved in cell wall biosynthesis
MADAARSLGAKNVFVLPAGIQLDVFGTSRIAEPSSFDIPRLITTRSLKPYYQVHLLVEAMQLLKQKGKRCTLTIAGEGSERGRLQSIVEKHDLADDVRFAGFVPNRSLPKLLAQHNTYVSLVPSDGVSASLLEAMAVGLLPIVPDHPANTDWVTHGDNGLLLSSTDPKTLAHSIESVGEDIRRRAWRNNPQLISERANLYRNAKVFVEQFSALVARRC